MGKESTKLWNLTVETHWSELIFILSVHNKIAAFLGNLKETETFQCKRFQKQMSNRNREKRDGKFHLFFSFDGCRVMQSKGDLVLRVIR